MSEHKVGDKKSCVLRDSHNCEGTMELKERPARTAGFTKDDSLTPEGIKGVEWVCDTCELTLPA